MSESTVPRRKSEGHLEYVEVETLILSAWNPNQMDEETFSALLETMRFGGMFAIKPIDVFPVGLNDRGLVKLQVADGHNRVRAARELGWKKMRAEVTTMTEDEAKVLNYERNWQRGQMNPVKEGELFFSFWKKGRGGLTEEEIAERFHRSQAHVSERLGLLKMPTEAKAAVLAGELPSSHAEAIYRTAIKEPEAQVAVARAAVAQKLTPDQTREVAISVEREAREAPEAPPRYLEERAQAIAKDIKAEDRGRQGKPIEIETITCDKCDADFIVFHVGPGKHRLVKVT